METSKLSERLRNCALIQIVSAWGKYEVTWWRFGKGCCPHTLLRPQYWVLSSTTISPLPRQMSRLKDLWARDHLDGIMNIATFVLSDGCSASSHFIKPNCINLAICTCVLRYHVFEGFPQNQLARLYYTGATLRAGQLQVSRWPEAVDFSHGVSLTSIARLCFPLALQERGNKENPWKIRVRGHVGKRS